MKNLNLIMNLNFLTPVEDDTSSDDYKRLEDPRGWRFHAVSIALEIHAMENSNENDENDLPSIHLKMVWRKTRKSFSVRIEGRSYVYRSLSKTTKMVPLRCGYPSCNAAVNFNLKSY